MRFTARWLLAAALLTPAIFPSSAYPDSPVLEYVGSTMWSGVGGASANGDYLYVTTPMSLMVFHRDGDSGLTFVSDTRILPGGWSRVEAIYDRAFLMNQQEVLAVDLSDPEHPVPGGSFSIPRDPSGLPASVTGVVPDFTAGRS